MKKLISIFFLVSITYFGFTQNLISNGTFENASKQLNCEGWFFSNGEPLSILTESGEICNSGFFSESDKNNWSLEIYSSFPGPNMVETYITGREGTHIYQLKYEMLSIGIGSSYMGKLIEGELEPGKNRTDTASNWQTFNLIDTFTTELNDTIVIGFSGDDCDFCPNTASFDNIEFSTDITSSIGNTSFNAIKVYPNPAKAILNFKMDQSPSGNYQLHIFNTVGQYVKMYNLKKSSLKINPNLSSGLYYYHLTGNKSQTLAIGKFVIE